QLFIAVNSILFDIDPHLGLAWLKLSIAVSIQPVKQRISKRHRHFISILIHRHLIGSPSGHKIRLAFYAGDVKKTKEQIVPPIVVGFDFATIEFIRLLRQVENWILRRDGIARSSGWVIRHDERGPGQEDPAGAAQQPSHEAPYHLPNPSSIKD